MNKEKQELLDAMAKIPGLNLKELTILVQNLPDAAEFEKMNDEFDAEMEISLQEALDYNPDDLTVVPQVKKGPSLAASTTSTTGSARITMRIPARVLAGVKAKAQKTCIPYQTWINRELQAALSVKQSPSQPV